MVRIRVTLEGEAVAMWYRRFYDPAKHQVDLGSGIIMTYGNMPIYVDVGEESMPLPTISEESRIELTIKPTYVQGAAGKAALTKQVFDSLAEIQIPVDEVRKMQIEIYEV